MSKKLTLKHIDDEIDRVKGLIIETKKYKRFSQDTKDVFIESYKNILGFLEEQRARLVDNIGRK